MDWIPARGHAAFRIVVEPIETFINGGFQPHQAISWVAFGLRLLVGCRSDIPTRSQHFGDPLSI